MILDTSIRLTIPYVSAGVPSLNWVYSGMKSSVTTSIFFMHSHFWKTNSTSLSPPSFSMTRLSEMALMTGRSPASFRNWDCKLIGATIATMSHSFISSSSSHADEMVPSHCITSFTAPNAANCSGVIVWRLNHNTFLPSVPIDIIFLFIIFSFRLQCRSLTVYLFILPQRYYIISYIQNTYYTLFYHLIFYVPKKRVNI